MENLKVQKYEVALKKPERKFNKYYIINSTNTILLFWCEASSF